MLQASTRHAKSIHSIVLPQQILAANSVDRNSIVNPWLEIKVWSQFALVCATNGFHNHKWMKKLQATCK